MKKHFLVQNRVIWRIACRRKKKQKIKKV